MVLDTGRQTGSPIDDLVPAARRIGKAIEAVIEGKRDAIQLTLAVLLAEGHLLIEDVPGVGKTSLAKAIAASIDCTWGRVQFTPDLLPTDVMGVTVWNRGTSEFDFRPGPIFANIVLGDEINRASPKTQSALLEAMEERQVTVDGTTYPLPESQLDRFLLRVAVGYPDRGAELEILDTHAAQSTLEELRPVATASDVRAMTQAARLVHVAPSLKAYLVDLAEASRRHPGLALGMSPRATLSLQRAARAYAAAQGRNYVLPDDVKVLAGPVLSHRLMLTPEAQLQGSDAAGVVADVLGSVAVPSGRTA